MKCKQNKKYKEVNKQRSKYVNKTKTKKEKKEEGTE